MSEDNPFEPITARDLSEILHRKYGMPYMAAKDVELTILGAPLLTLFMVAKLEPDGRWEGRFKFPEDGTFHITVQWEGARE